MFRILENWTKIFFCSKFNFFLKSDLKLSQTILWNCIIYVYRKERHSWDLCFEWYILILFSSWTNFNPIFQKISWFYHFFLSLVFANFFDLAWNYFKLINNKKEKKISHKKNQFSKHKHTIHSHVSYYGWRKIIIHWAE